MNWDLDACSDAIAHLRVWHWRWRQPPKTGWYPPGSPESSRSSLVLEPTVSPADRDGARGLEGDEQEVGDDTVTRLPTSCWHRAWTRASLQRRLLSDLLSYPLINLLRVVGVQETIDV